MSFKKTKVVGLEAVPLISIQSRLTGRSFKCRKHSELNLSFSAIDFVGVSLKKVYKNFIYFRGKYIGKGIALRLQFNCCGRKMKL